MVSTPGAAASKQGILSVAFRDKNSLYLSYMPFVKGGGLFVPTSRSYQIGDSVFLLVTLPEEGGRVPVAGKVVWITPGRAQGNRTSGVGIQFNETPDAEALKTKIESILAGLMTSDRPTHTM
ncbi:MAG: PilZ domain-containing protein [Xanthomonadales bacterium]|nr:PilZ domain-containing protein [Xanthomonadales bacterium]